MQADFEVTYDPKAKNISVTHANLFDKVRKECKDVLKVNPFQVNVEVAMESALSDKEAVEAVARKAALETEKEVLKELDDALKVLRKLQDDEKKGNSKAATEADKAAKKAEKDLKKYAAEFGVDVRKAVQKEYARQSGTKAQLRSVNRTAFRGMELNEDAFEYEAESSEALGDLSQLAAKLETIGKEIAKLAKKEKELRRELTGEVERVYKLIEAQRGGKTPFEIEEFVNKNGKDAKAVEGLAKNYQEFLGEMKDARDRGLQQFIGIQKIGDKSDKLQNDKQYAKAMNDYGEGHEVVSEMIGDYADAAESARKLFKDSYGKGDGWKRLVDDLSVLKGCTKSGTKMQDGASDLAKLAKG